MTAAETAEKLYGTEAAEERRRDALLSGRVPIAVYGLGKMGLPLAAAYAEVTGNVTGVDVDEAVVRAINDGECHVGGEPGLAELVQRTVADGAFEATTDSRNAAARASVHVVIVPTLIEDGEPDLSIVEAVAADIAQGLEPGDLVVFESTLPPRTCRDVLLPLLEEQSGLELGEFGLAFCPERTSSGRALKDIRGAHPKIVGGADAESARAAELLYGEITDNEVVRVSDATTAESVKVFEGVYRDVNIALANELARHGDRLGIDVVEAIEAANGQPYCDIHDPGAGVGGHCIPYYPHFLIEPFDADSQLMETAREVNEAMPGYTAELALDGLRAEGIDPDDADVLVMGLTYRPGVAEIRATPALPAIDRLDDAGADVDAVDPVLDEYGAFRDAGASIVAADELVTSRIVAAASDAEADDGAASDAEAQDGEETSVSSPSYDAVVLVTAQEQFDRIDVPELGGDSGRGDDEEGRLVVVDGRQALTALRGDDRVRYEGVGLDG